MKKLFIIIFFPLLMSSCMTSREAKTSKAEVRRDKTLTNQLLVKNAVDNRKFIIKLNRVYSYRGGPIDLVPRANFIIVDGPRTIISTAYVGRQFDIRGISAINMRGRTQEYAVTAKQDKGSYEIKLKVDNGGSNSFDVYLNISKNGYCSASVSSLKIDNIRYSGYLVPLAEKAAPPAPEGNII